MARALLLPAALLACGDAAGVMDHAGPAGHAEHAGPAVHGVHGAPPVAADPSDLSVYNLDAEWRDRTGAARALGSLGGRVRLVAMVYTSCGYACPRLILDMKRIEGELGGGGEVGFVLVSIDPARDTPARLAAFADGARLDPDRWTLLTGDDDAILELAAVLGVQYRRTDGGEFVHGNLITVLDRHGEIAHRQDGLAADPRATVEVIERLLAGGG